jgi:hypothetical protein
VAGVAAAAAVVVATAAPPDGTDANFTEPLIK